LKDFFSHELQSFPPSLSDLGRLYLTGTKSELLKCLEEPGQPEPPINFDCKVLDGAVIVHCLPTNAVSTFDEYSSKVFFPYVSKQLDSSKRVDIVWDTYLPGSLKDSTREKRGKGIRRKVSGPAKLPTNWPDFLRNVMNKKELFDFLSNKAGEMICPPNKAIHITSGRFINTPLQIV